MKSSSGRIPAGSVPLAINDIGSGMSKQAFSIEKCPDKKAEVEMSVFCECLN